MDTSETYIKMRLAAIPDLGMGEPPEAVSKDIDTGDDIYIFLTDTIIIDVKGDWYYVGETNACQLERQDQLQEMLGFCGASDIYGWLKRVTFFQIETPYQSFEQLWLAFVMKEKYNKTWNGEEWI